MFLRCTPPVETALIILEVLTPRSRNRELCFCMHAKLFPSCCFSTIKATQQQKGSEESADTRMVFSPVALRSHAALL